MKPRREFWINNYDTIRMLNPRFPFILRDIPDENVEPYMIVKMGAFTRRSLEIRTRYTHIHTNTLTLTLAQFPPSCLLMFPCPPFCLTTQ